MGAPHPLNTQTRKVFPIISQLLAGPSSPEDQSPHLVAGRTHADLFDDQRHFAPVPRLDHDTIAVWIRIVTRFMGVITDNDGAFCTRTRRVLLLSRSGTPSRRWQ